MDIPPLHRGVRAADLPLEKLAASREVSEPEKIAEASRQFEAVLLRQILSQAQKPLFKSSMLSDSSRNAIYQDMITAQLADRISRGGSFGFGKILEQQLTSRFVPAKGQEPQEPPSESRAVAPKTRPQPGKRI